MSNRILSFHYVLTGAGGEVMDSSRDGKPFQILEGRGQIIPGLEAELFKMKTGEKKKVFVPADQAYGPVNEDLKVKVSRSQLPEGELEIGTRFHTGDEGRGPVFMVTIIEGDDVYLDGNHPLAGEDLNFEVEVLEIREATKEELEHGHAHGPDGHHH